jgi:hypothetical protein
MDQCAPQIQRDLDWLVLAERRLQETHRALVRSDAGRKAEDALPFVEEVFGGLAPAGSDRGNGQEAGFTSGGHGNSSRQTCVRLRASVRPNQRARSTAPGPGDIAPDSLSRLARQSQPVSNRQCRTQLLIGEQAEKISARGRAPRPQNRAIFPYRWRRPGRRLSAPFQMSRARDQIGAGVPRACRGLPSDPPQNFAWCHHFTEPMSQFGYLTGGTTHARRGRTIMRSTEAWAKAAECAAQAEETADEQARILLSKLRDSWIRVAHNCEFIETVESSRPALPVGGW